MIPVPVGLEDKVFKRSLWHAKCEGDAHKHGQCDAYKALHVLQSACSRPKEIVCMECRNQRCKRSRHLQQGGHGIASIKQMQPHGLERALARHTDCSGFVVEHQHQPWHRALEALRHLTTQRLVLVVFRVEKARRGSCHKTTTASVKVCAFERDISFESATPTFDILVY